MNTTSIVPMQQSSQLVVPKPTQQQIISAMAHAIIAERKAHNEKLKIVKEGLIKKYKAAVAKLVKTKIVISSLKEDAWTGESYGESLHVRYASIKGSSEMERLTKKMAELDFKTDNYDMVVNEIKTKMHQETITAILEQPGFKECVQSACAKLNL